MCPVIVIMVKAPRAGSVKTRLTPPLTETEAAKLAECFAQDVVRKSSRIVTDLIIAYTPSDGCGALETLLQEDNVIWHKQHGENLGERMKHIAAQAFDMNFSPVIIIGTDSPTLPPRFIKQAIQTLENGESDIALGPTEDGGYYLIGFRQHPAPEIFQNVEWSTSQTYEQTARNAKLLNLKLHKLPLWYDVDTHTDLLRLRREIFSNKEAQQLAPATYKEIFERIKDKG